MNYPDRTKYNEELGEGSNFIFDEDSKFCVSVQWNGKKYLITHAWLQKDLNVLKTLELYPFVRSKADRVKVETIIQSQCDHDWDYYPEHASCWDCKIDKKGDFQKEYDSQQSKDQAEISEGFTQITCNYRLKTFKLNPEFTRERFHAKFLITDNWICLLEGYEFFRKKCSDSRKAVCKHALVGK